MQAWLLYQLRFLIAADLACAWTGFGGLAAQLNHLSIVMNISITYSDATTKEYNIIFYAIFGLVVWPPGP